MNRTIPFMDRFTEPLLSGRKTWTSRPRKMADVGDTFTVLAGTFEVDYVFKMPLGVVATYNWEQEGCVSASDFVTVWNHIHPIKGFVDSELVWVHVFHKMEESKS